ncbi:MAG: rod shape-determining protein MreC [Chloroflexota bacterium]
MNAPTPQRLRWIIIGTLVAIAIFLSILDSSGNLDSFFAFVRNPMTTILSWTSTQANDLNDAVDGPASLEEARLEIEALQTRIDELELENETLREVQGDYQILLDLVNRARQTPEISRITASVIGYDTSPSVRSLIIDRGTEDGIVVGMPVESSRGLVGRVFRTTANASQVALITDNASTIPVRLGTSRATGVLTGGGIGGETTIDWIDQGFQIERGEIVLTSGLGGNFPADMIIGRVSEVDRNDAELFQQSVVQPAVDFDSLELVFVITGFQPVDTSIFESP